MPPKKTPFNRSHEAEYGLEVTQFGLTRAVVKTVECLFCRYYGRIQWQKKENKSYEILPNVVSSGQVYKASGGAFLLKLAKEELPRDATFEASWSIPHLGGRFNHLMEFAGGLASPFPHTATAESDFSIVKYETDNSRDRLENHSLEGIMQCKEHIRMKAIITVKKIY